MVVSGSFINTGLPILPFTLQVSNENTKLIRETIGKHEQVFLERKEFDSISEFNKHYVIGKSKKLDYLEQVYSYKSEFFYGYPSNDPKIMSLDIEVLTDGSGVFPRAKEKPVVAIGVKMVGEPIRIFSVKTVSDYCDFSIIWDMIDFISENDPDIIATYNGIRFDIDYLMKRMEVHNINPNVIARTGMTGISLHGKDDIDLDIVSPSNIPGRIHWDLYRDVDHDQTLLGMPNKRLKTVASHFEWSDVIDLGREALSNTSTLVGTDELDEYLGSDVQLTENLTGVYIDNHLAVANLIGLPLREEMTMYSSLVSKVLHIRNLSDKYVAVDTNKDRYNKMLGTMRYESARVAIYSPDEGGRELNEDECLQKYFPDVNKVDFSSQYPSAMMTFNLSPDTTEIIEVRPYTGIFNSIKKVGVSKKTGKNVEYLWLDIPDANAQKQIIIRVDLSYNSFLRRVLSELKVERLKIKALMKDDPNNKTLYSRQWAIKVIMNTIYGYEGLITSSWGDLGVAIGIVGICRYLITEVERYLGNIKVAVDTDGVIIIGTTDIDVLNKHMSEFIMSKFGIESDMGIEFEEVGEAVFYRMKNYITRDKNGKITRKGVVFKSSRHSRIYDRVLNKIIDGYMNRLSDSDMWELIKDVRNMEQYTLTDFIMSASLRQAVEEYGNPGQMQPVLARQAAESLGINIGIGDSIDYVVTKGKNYTLASMVNDRVQIDFDYYRDDIDKILNVFGIKEINQMTLFK